MKLLKNKKIIMSLLVLLALIGGFFWWRGRTTTPEETKQKQKLTLPNNVIPGAERPYLSIEPLADGRNVEITIHNLKKDAQEMEYELEYQAGTLLQGAFGTLDLASLPATAQILLGSCSAGGACTYHEDVKGGTLLTRYTGGSEPYALKSDWKYIDNSTRETAHSSKDAKFQIDGRNLGQQRYLIIFNTPGYPEGIPGEIVSENYALTASGVLSGKVELTMRANEEGELKIAAWDGSKWVTYEGKVDGKMITATVDLVEVYVVVR
ncbi:MAG: hypothetical protein UY13_C0002G0351 [Candidatus Pacebacteria bacterium GW2011_GWB1_47_8]|nr:MAG: hypothetical protein UX28_C0001G0499 [Candidatus Pacebacteria bacterium GW2011_GWA1_46_10]KKU84439.1 MAG: hypothetical protein UY13_C0002G0351 [Candidatus Pacebacteria bacterium GW2011_GWB1_47_8]HCR81128.1 hypothetical protein [Candidatus Paceibacterota bacterium]